MITHPLTPLPLSHEAVTTASSVGWQCVAETDNHALPTMTTIRVAFTDMALTRVNVHAIAAVLAPSLLLLLDSADYCPITLTSRGDAVCVSVQRALHPDDADLIVPLVGALLAWAIRQTSRGDRLRHSHYTFPSLLGARHDAGHVEILPCVSYGRTSLCHGRLTCVDAVLDDAHVCVTAQQALTAVYVQAERDMRRWVSIEQATAMRAAVIGARVLPIDARFGVDNPAAWGEVSARRDTFIRSPQPEPPPRRPQPEPPPQPERRTG